MQRKATRKQQLQDFFARHIGKTYGSWFLHQKFGTATRARISELNADPECPIEIINSYEPLLRSVYHACFKVGACSDCKTRQVQMAKGA